MQYHQGHCFIFTYVFLDIVKNEYERLHVYVLMVCEFLYLGDRVSRQAIVARTSKQNNLRKNT